MIVIRTEKNVPGVAHFICASLFNFIFPRKYRFFLVWLNNFKNPTSLEDKAYDGRQTISLIYPSVSFTYALN